MKDIDPDTVMIATGVVITAIASVELYSAWKQTQKTSSRHRTAK
jgi:hypothetical protein